MPTAIPARKDPVVFLRSSEDTRRRAPDFCQVSAETGQLTTENERLVKELQRLNELLSTVSHELRTPLASIKGFVTALLQPDVRWDKETQKDFLQTIDQEADRLNRLISDLMDMSRIEAKALKMERGDYQVSRILDSVSGRLAKLTENHKLQIIIPEALSSVFVDEMRISQVLTNLVENSVKYSRMNGLITIEAKLDGERVIVSVTDQGEGIPPEALPHIFSRFYRVENSTRGRKSGTGLGLYICRSIIEAHEGEIWVESRAGEGSRFSFSLPAIKKLRLAEVLAAD